MSTKTSWLAPSIAMPRIRVRVVCTLWVTIETLAPTIRFRSVDLPAFGSPISATKPQRVAVAHASASSRSSNASAAACCAARFDAARPSAARPSPSRASTENSGAWSGPTRSRST